MKKVRRSIEECRQTRSCEWHWRIFKIGGKGQWIYAKRLWLCTETTKERSNSK